MCGTFVLSQKGITAQPISPEGARKKRAVTSVRQEQKFGNPKNDFAIGAVQ
jgi:hypothetical protein